MRGREKGCNMNKMRCWDGDGDKGWNGERKMHANRWREEEEEEEEGNSSCCCEEKQLSMKFDLKAFTKPYKVYGTYSINANKSVPLCQSCVGCFWLFQIR